MKYEEEKNERMKRNMNPFSGLGSTDDFGQEVGPSYHIRATHEHQQPEATYRSSYGSHHGTGAVDELALMISGEKLR